MMGAPLLSVIVPVYNVALYLMRCMDSILNQTYKNLEIILVDDGSTDASGKICDDCARSDSRVRVIHKQNGGLVSARKAGLQAANGEYATYVDSDDFIEPEMYETYMELAMKHGVDVVGGGKIRDYGTHTVFEPEALPPGLYDGSRLDFLRENLIDTQRFFKYNISAHVIDKVYKTELLRKHQMSVPDKVSIGEDASVIYPLFFDARRVCVSGRNFYHYCLRQDSVMGAKRLGKNDPAYLMLDYIKAQLTGSWNIFGEQFRAFELYTLLLRNPQQVLRYIGEVLFPFGSVRKSDRIIVYGAGKFGIALKEFLGQNGFTVVAWVDNARGLPGTQSWAQAKSTAFDKVLIAALVYEAKQSILQSLEADGASRDKILFIPDSCAAILTIRGGYGGIV